MKPIEDRMFDVELFSEAELTAIAYAQQSTTALDPTHEELSFDDLQYYSRIARAALLRNIDVISNELSGIDADGDDYSDLEFYRHQFTQCLARIRA